MTDRDGRATGRSVEVDPWPRLTPRRARRLGWALMAFGLVGLLLVGAAGALVLGSLNAVGAAVTGFEAQRDEIVEMLGPASDALAGAASSASNAGTSLSQTSAAARNAAELTTRLAESFENLASLSSFNIFGARPFESVAGQFASVGVEARQLSTDLTATADAMATNITDSQAVAGQLELLATQLEELEASLANIATPSAGSDLPLTAATIVLLGLLAWFAIFALASIWLGGRLIRAGS